VVIFIALAILLPVKYPDFHLNRGILGSQSCLDAFEERNISLIEQCVFFGSHMIDGLCCNPVLKYRPYFNLEIKILRSRDTFAD